MTAAATTLSEEAARALTLGEARAHANGHHAMLGAEYILYGVLEYIEQESVELWIHTPFRSVSAEMVMGQIVLISHHSDPEDELMRCDCYESVLVRAIELSNRDDSAFVELKHLLLAILGEEGSLALGILTGFCRPKNDFDALRRGELN